ncbi:MAG: hypothetical protein ACREGJ_04825 [Candidatus Saccharimonadales bacterium]
MLSKLAGRVGLFLILTSCVAFVTVPYVHSLQSPNYKFDESAIGTGGLIQSSSANFQADSAIGGLAIGNAASANFQVEAGSKTTNDPALSFGITNANIDLGSFTSSGATVTTATFLVSNYTSYGYVVQILGDPPKNGNHTIDAMATTSPSQAGIDQFGINLVANTLPLSVGANPDNGDSGFGEAAPNYGTSNEYRYVSGETIARAPKSSGVTNYTISYLVNVETLTPGGKFTANQTLIVTGTY